jgi:Protein of unknown function (DUF2853)
MSALPPEADIRQRIKHVCFVPLADITAVTKLGPLCADARTSLGAPPRLSELPKRGETVMLALLVDLSGSIDHGTALRRIDMAENWAADVKKYVPNADEKAIDGIVKYCGIALQKRDSSLVSFTDKEEVARVRNHFLKKKLGLTQSDSELDKAIMVTADQMKGDRTKNRVTVYYLLAEHFGKLSMFG